MHPDCPQVAYAWCRASFSESCHSKNDLDHEWSDTAGLKEHARNRNGCGELIISIQVRIFWIGLLGDNLFGDSESQALAIYLDLK